MITIDHINHEGKGQFQAQDNGVEIGVMEYVEAAPNRLIIQHTEVSPTFVGHGVGRTLLLSLVDYARAHDRKVIAVCPYARMMFEKQPAIRDVLVEAKS